MKKRTFLGAMAGAAALVVSPRIAFAVPASDATEKAPRLVAAWRSQQRLSARGIPQGTTSDTPIDYVGILAPDWEAGIVRIDCAVAVPNRVHGLLPDVDGGFIVCANRPGGWLMRCDAEGRVVVRHVLEESSEGRTLNGHVLFDPSGEWILTAESEPGTGFGWVSVRNRRTLRKEAEWSTAGIEPHDLKFDSAGGLLVANGGILRAAGDKKRDLDKMSSSLVRLDIKSGKRLGQWTVEDQRLSLRHLAVAPSPTRDGRWLVGVAIQAEHSLATEREAAPVLAVWDGESLTIPSREVAGGGYSGDISAGPGGVFYLSAERVNRVVRWHPEAPGEFQVVAELEKSGALAPWLAGGAQGALIGSPRGLGAWHPARDPKLARWSIDMAPDNHWVMI